MHKEKKIIAHNDQLNFLLKNLNNRFPHTLLFSGPKGIGKYTTAMSFIDKIFKNKMNYEQNVFKINDDENKPALIDEIRKLINQVSLTNSNFNEKSFIIIDNADSLNFNSFNALLKTLEEPPKNTVIIMICHDFKKIPKTIVSRCLKIDFRTLTLNEMRKYCQINNIDLSNINLDENYQLFGGSIEKMLLFLSEDGQIIISKFKKIVKRKKLNYLEFEDLYNFIAPDYDRFFKIIINCIYTFQKNKYINNQNNEIAIKGIIKFFNKLDNFFKQDLNIDKKKELHYLLTEYITTNIDG